MPIVLAPTVDQLLHALVFLAGAVCGIAVIWTLVRRHAGAGRRCSGDSAAADVERLLRTIRSYM